MDKIEVDLYECKRCGHKWIPRLSTVESGERPIVCASCRSPYWERPLKDDN